MRLARDSTRLLAVHGGRPVRESLLSYGHQHVDEDDIRAVVDVLRGDWITTGPKVSEFEEAFAERVGSRYAICFSSGTAALHGACFAAQLSEGDEAITSPMTFCATSNCVIYQGARPVFADVRADTLNVDVNKVEEQLTERTKAILPVDYAGHPADLAPILELAERRDVVVIEDASHALGAVYRSRLIGNVSHMTVFSFHPVKHITTGEGGIVTTNDSRFSQRLRAFRNHGIESDPRRRQATNQWFYEMNSLGYNYRLTDIACALGLSQLRKLKPNLARRRQIAEQYTAAFKRMPSILTQTVLNDVDHAWHLYPIRLASNLDRSSVFAALRAENIGINVHYIPVHLHPYYRERFGYRGGEYPVAERAYQQLISLPMFHSMTDRDVQDVITAVTKVIAWYEA